MVFNITMNNLLLFIKKCKIEALNLKKQSILYLNNLYNYNIKNNNINNIKKVYNKNKITNIIVYFN